MAGLGVAIVLGAVVASMGIAFYAYSAYQTNLVTGAAGEPVRVGPVEYVVTFDGTSAGDRDTRPEGTFVRIGIVAENKGAEDTFLSGGQFFINGGGRNIEATYGEFSENDLLYERIEPGKPVQRTTQFDVEFDEDKRYDVIIRPQKEQSTVDTASVCILGCPGGPDG